MDQRVGNGFINKNHDFAQSLTRAVAQKKFIEFFIEPGSVNFRCLF